MKDAARVQHVAKFREVVYVDRDLPETLNTILAGTGFPPNRNGRRRRIVKK